MPNRIIKESINESRGLSHATAFSQDLYKRLITYADDYGRFNVDPEMIVARLYPRELDSVLPGDVMDGMIDLVGAEKISIYRCAARPKDVYGYFPAWSEHQRIRDSKHRNPEPEENINDWYLRRFIPHALKLQIFERDKCTCKLCGKSFFMDGISVKRQMRILSAALHIDHAVPVNQGGRATIENLRLACAGCNLKRKKVVTVDDLLRELAGFGVRQESAATHGDSPPNPIQENPIQSNPIRNPIQSYTPANAVVITEKAVSKNMEITLKGLLEMFPDLPEQAAKDWLTVRKKKKAPLTLTAIAGIKREAIKAGITPAQAIAYAAAKSWQGFEADWYTKNKVIGQSMADRMAHETYKDLLNPVGGDDEPKLLT